MRLEGIRHISAKSRARKIDVAMYSLYLTSLACPTGRRALSVCGILLLEHKQLARVALLDFSGVDYLNEGWPKFQHLLAFPTFFAGLLVLALWIVSRLSVAISNSRHRRS